MTDTEPKPMDPEHLASLRRFLVARAACDSSREMATELLEMAGAHDYWRTRAERAEKQARLTHAEYLQAAPEERAMMEAGAAEPLDVLREMHQRTVAELRARAERAEADTDALRASVERTREYMTETIWLVAAAFGADRDALCCAKVVRHMDRRELGTRCLHGRRLDPEPQPDDAPKPTDAQRDALHARWLPLHMRLARGPDTCEDAPSDCPLELLGPCGAGDRGHHTHTVDGVVYEQPDPIDTPGIQS